MIAAAYQVCTPFQIDEVLMSMGLQSSLNFIEMLMIERGLWQRQADSVAPDPRSMSTPGSVNEPKAHISAVPMPTAADLPVTKEQSERSPTSPLASSKTPKNRKRGFCGWLTRLLRPRKDAAQPPNVVAQTTLVEVLTTPDMEAA